MERASENGEENGNQGEMIEESEEKKVDQFCKLEMFATFCPS